MLTRVRLLTPWTVALQAPLSMGFPRQEYWSGWPCRSPGDLPNPGIKPGSPALQAGSLAAEPPGKRLKNWWNSLGQNGVGSLSVLQGIFPTQGSNLGLPHCKRILYQLSHKGSPQGKLLLSTASVKGSGVTEHYARQAEPGILPSVPPPSTLGR